MAKIETKDFGNTKVLYIIDGDNVIEIHADCLGGTNDALGWICATVNNRETSATLKREDIKRIIEHLMKAL